MMLWAVAGPMPSSSSSCSSVAVLTLSGTPGGGAAAVAVPVPALGGQVDLAQVRPPGGTTGAADRVVDPRVRPHAVHAGLTHRTGDMDDDRAAARGAVLHPDRGGRSRSRLRAAVARQMPDGEDREHERGEGAGSQLAGRDLGHGRATYGRRRNGSARDRDDSRANV